MCEPVSMAIGLGVAQAGAQTMAQKQQAKVQAEMQRRASEEERKRYLRQVSAQRTEQRMQKIAMAQKLQANQLQAESAKATAGLSALSAGIKGKSVDMLLNDFSRKEAQYNFSVQQQDEINEINANINLENAIGNSRANLLQINQPIEEPDYFGNILDGVSTGFGMYNSMNQAGFQGFAGFGKKNSVSTIAKASQNPANMGMLDLPGRDPFKTYG